MKHLSFFTQNIFHGPLANTMVTAISKYSSLYLFICTTSSTFRPDSVQSVHHFMLLWISMVKGIMMLSLFKNYLLPLLQHLNIVMPHLIPSAAMIRKAKNIAKRWKENIPHEYDFHVYKPINAVQTLASVGDVLVPAVLEQLQTLPTSPCVRSKDAWQNQTSMPLKGFLSWDQFSQDQFSRDQLSWNQLAMTSTLTRPTCQEINSIFIYDKEDMLMYSN